MVGDSMLAHAGNRVCIVPMAKPTVDEWLAWATEAGVSRVIRTFVKMFPRSMASYMDGEQDDNPYIFHPKKSALSFCSPRSLYKADANVAVPDDIAAQLMIMFQAVDVLETQDELSSFMEFVDRIKSSEIQAVFFTMMMRNTRTIRLARNNKSISTWASNNHELF
jgi:hypothetical protein